MGPLGQSSSKAAGWFQVTKLASAQVSVSNNPFPVFLDQGLVGIDSTDGRVVPTSIQALRAPSGDHRTPWTEFWL